MENAAVLMWLGIAVSALSFWGISSFIKHKCRIDGMVAPFMSACAVIILLMLGGMAGVLRWTKYALQAVGLVSFAYYNIVRRKKPDWLAVGIIAALFVFCVLRFSGQFYTENDSISHWGLVAKHLFKYNAFPNAQAEYIYFQDYPLGTACFMYFFACVKNIPESFCLTAQFMLMAVSCMPVLAFVKKNRWLGWALTAVYFIFASAYHIYQETLRVDVLLPLITLGATAGIFSNAKRPILQILITAMTAAVLVFVKNSGAFFAAVLIVLAAAVIYRNAPDKKVRAALRAVLVSALSMVAAFVLWNVYVKFSFESGHATKHAVSLASYSANAQLKDFALIKTIALGLVKQLVTPEASRLIQLALFAALLAGCALYLRFKKEMAPKWKPLIRTALISCIVFFALWYVMLFMMYVFSMPSEEAAVLASLGRYESSALIYISGVAVMICAAFFCDQEILIAKLLKRLFICFMALVAIVGAAKLLYERKGDVIDFFAGNRAETKRRATAVLNDKYEIENGKRYLFFSNYSDQTFSSALYMVKYEFMSNDIIAIINADGQKGMGKNEFFVFEDVFAHTAAYTPTTDVCASLMEYADQVDYILVLNKDELFEAEVDKFMSVYEGDTPVMYAYDR